MAIIDKKGFIRGRIGNMVYRKVGDTNIIQSRPGKVRQTAATKESALEFGLASSTAKVLRQMFAGLSHYADGGMINRLNNTVLNAIRNGDGATRGHRDLHQGDLSALIGFQFNKNSPLDETLLITPDIVINNDGSVKVMPPAMDSSELCWLDNAQGCSLRFTVISVDFKQQYHQLLGHHEIEVTKGKSLEQMEWITPESAENGSIVLVALSVVFYAPDGIRHNGIVLNDKSFFPAAIIAAFHAPETADGKENKETKSYRLPLPGYLGGDILRELERLQLKESKKRNNNSSGMSPPSGKGKILFN
ncbi:hypothetical protein [Pseudopedobacter beijingensis]|uniref:Uncharacterized protein n=1 Tax=Pseudopedobacter beijingensis TaxID=1207056 RepID=A0ABW4I7U6_9SPHI